MPSNLIHHWPYDYVRQLADEATINARHENLRPATDLEVIANYKHSHRFNIPFLGDFVPDGWTRLEGEEVFVDITGRGRPGEYVITGFEFFKRAQERLRDSTETIGYGVIEQGPTQALVVAYRKG